MSLTYDGSHSMAFIKVADGSPIIKRSWEDWHLIPATPLVVNPAPPSVSFTPVPGSSRAFDATAIPTGFPTFSARTGDWEFIVDHDQWSSWHEAYDEICSFVNGRRLYCVLDDEYGKMYAGRTTFKGWKNEKDYSRVQISYVFEPLSLFNEFDYLDYVGTYATFDQGNYVFKHTWPIEWLRPYIRVWKEYEGGRYKEITDYELSGNTGTPGDAQINVLYEGQIDGNEYVFSQQFVAHVTEDGWEVDDTNILDVYPVGSIYMSVTSTSPQTLFGGLWQAWGQGRVPVGVKSTDEDFSVGELTGGSKTHALTVDELPAHTHTHEYRADSGANVSGSNPDNLGSVVRLPGSTGTTSQWETSSVGSSNSISLMQPYITCYMWKRIS